LQFPKLPVLEDLVSEVGHVPQLQNTVLVGLQHILETTGSMLQAFFQMGLKPGNVFLTGKIYSEHPETAYAMKDELGITYLEPRFPRFPGTYDQCLDQDANRLWRKARSNSKDAEKIVVLDDGGHLLRTVPRPLLNERRVVGVEQTTFGIQRQTPFGHFPVVQVATSAAKSYLEPSLITETIFEKAKMQVDSVPMGTVGVVGLGHIGEAVARGALEHRERVFTFDKDESRSLDLQATRRCNSLTELVDGSEVIFGCTGQDISHTAWPSEIRDHKILVSCSSSDIEFRWLLRTTSAYRSFDPESPLAPLEVEFPTTGLRLTVLRGGFPINFDRTKESVPARDIQLTRGLLAGGVLQAARDLPSDAKKNKVALDPRQQRRVVHSWLDARPNRRATYDNGVLENFNRLDWVEKHSGGYLPGRGVE